MKPQTPPRQRQGNFLYQDLLEQLNPKDPLLLLAGKIPWEIFDREFSMLYADRGRPGKPIRLMVGLLLLKQIENLRFFDVFCGITRTGYRLSAHL